MTVRPAWPPARRRRRPAGIREPWGTFRVRARSAALAPPLSPDRRGAASVALAAVSPRAAAEAGGDHVELAAVLAAGRRLGVAHGAEVALQRLQERALAAALEHLGDEAAARRQGLQRRVERELGQRHDAQVVGRAVPGGVGRHVGQHQVGGAAERRQRRRLHRLVPEVALDDRGARAPGPSAAGRPRRPARSARRARPPPGSSRPARRRGRARARPAGAGGACRPSR